MNYISVKEAAAKWGVSTIYVQRLCMNGRIEGAVKLSGIWAIPEDAEKPADMRKSPAKKSTDTAKKQAPPEAEPPKSAPPIKSETDRVVRTMMPLMNTPYTPGTALKCVNRIADADERAVALGEYYYFGGQSEKASDIVEEYLTHPDIAVRLSACLLYAYANLALDRIPRVHQAMAQILSTAKSADALTPPDTNLTPYVLRQLREHFCIYPFQKMLYR